jgi:hypothetical protein
MGHGLADQSRSSQNKVGEEEQAEKGSSPKWSHRRYNHHDMFCMKNDINNLVLMNKRVPVKTITRPQR